MENASKALIIAGTILIGVLLLALMVYLFSGASGLRRAYSNNVNNTRITEFNTKFTKYNITENMYDSSDGRDYVTIRDIVTLANYAKEFNEGLTEEDSVYIKVSLNNVNISGNSIEDNNKLLKDYMDYKFVSKGVTLDNNTGRIKSISFIEL